MKIKMENKECCRCVIQKSAKMTDRADTKEEVLDGGYLGTLFLCNLCFGKRAFQRLGELIGAGGRLKAAADPRKALDHLVGIHTDGKGGKSLCVARAAALKFHGGDYVILHCNINAARANAARHKRKFLCHGFILSN